MSFDLNTVEPQQGGDLIPEGTFAKVTMVIRPGAQDGDGEADRGLLRASNAPGSDVLSLDCEFTVTEGPFARRKFWQMFTVKGGKCDEHGQSIGWTISKQVFRAMIDSALGLNPKDMSDAAKAKRTLRGLCDLNGITFVAKIAIKKSNNPNYRDKNQLGHAVLPTAPEWRKVMDGATVGAGSGIAAPAADWQAPQTSQTNMASTPPTDPSPAPFGEGPSWLNQ